MGVVYRAHDRNLDTEVVIKMPRRSALEEPDFAERFDLEVRALVRLAHPHVVKILDVGRHDGLPFAVMQYLAGGSLLDRVERDGMGRAVPAHPGTLSSWLPAIAGALDFVHQQGMLHRDVKPANILFDTHGHPFLSDFGVAKVLTTTGGKEGTRLTGAGLVLGTPEYMSPELIMGQKCDGRVDQYALAATVYEMLAGRTPFQGTTPAAILVKQTTQKLAALVWFNPDVSPPLAEAIEKGLAKDPARRYPNCTALVQAIVEAARTDVPNRPQAQAGPPPLPEPASEPARGNSEPVKPAAPPPLSGAEVPPDDGPRVRMVCPVCGVRLQVSARLAETGNVLCPHCQVQMVPVGAGKQVHPLRGSPAPPPPVPEGVPTWIEPRIVPNVALVGDSLGVGPGFPAPPLPEFRPPAARTAREPTPTEILERLERPRLPAFVTPRRLRWLLSGLLLLLAVGVVVLVVSQIVALVRDRQANRGGFELRQPAGLVLPRGTRKVIAIAVERDRFRRPIKIECIQPPDGVTVAPVELETDQEQGELEVTIDREARPGPREIRLTATAARGREEETTLRVEVVPLRLRLEPVPIALSSGEKLDLNVPLERDGYQGPVELLVLRPQDHPALHVRAVPDHPLTLRIEVPDDQGEAAGELLLQARIEGAPIGEAVPLKYHVRPFLGVLRGLPAPALYLALSPDGRRLAVADQSGQVTIWSSLSGKETLRFRPPGDQVWHGRETVPQRAGDKVAVVSVDWGGEGFLLATVDSKGKVGVWDPATGKPARTLEGNDKRLLCVAINPAGSRLAAGAEDGRLHVWDLKTGKLEVTQTSHTRKIVDLSWSPDGAWLASASEDGTVGIHDTQEIKQVRRLQGHPGGANTLAFRGDSKELAVGDSQGGVHLWDVQEGKEVRGWKGHEGIVFAVQYSPEGGRLLTGGVDGLGKVWDATTGKPILTLTGHADAVTGVSYTTDGKRIITASHDRTVRLWDARTGK